MIRIVGLGPSGPESMTQAARDALRAASTLFVRTVRHPAVGWLRSEGIGFIPFDSLYESAPDFASVYSHIADQVLTAAGTSDVAFAVPGHPLMGEQSVQAILERARQKNIPVEIISAASFIDAVVSALQLSWSDGLMVLDAQSLELLDHQPRLDLLLYHLYDQASASEAKLKLTRYYPDEHPIAVVHHAGIPGEERIERKPLYQLDHGPIDHLVTVHLPPLRREDRRAAFGDLVQVMARLRAPDGCPWDREQSHETLKRYLVEECYEAIEAIDEGDLDSLCDEMGDVLLQVVFHAQLGEEAGQFDIDEVIQRIVDKLIRRHPHVFGDLNVSGTEEVLTNWEAIKRGEKGDDWRSSILDGVPKGLPALARAMELSKKVAKVGFEWASLDDVRAKLSEEIGELDEAIREGDKVRVAAELGDALFALVQIARWLKVDPEDSLRHMLRRFTTRFQYIESQAKERGTPLESLGIDEMDRLWNEAKRQEPKL